MKLDSSDHLTISLPRNKGLRLASMNLCIVINRIIDRDKYKTVKKGDKQKLASLV